MVKLNDIDCDNGGGITLQKLSGKKYLHTYNDPAQLAEDIVALMSGDNPADEWDGNEIIEYEPVDPTYDDVRNGGYRVYTVASIIAIAKDADNEEYRDAYDMPGEGWYNVSGAIQSLRNHFASKK